MDGNLYIDEYSSPIFFTIMLRIVVFVDMDAAINNILKLEEHKMKKLLITMVLMFSFSSFGVEFVEFRVIDNDQVVEQNDYTVKIDGVEAPLYMWRELESGEIIKFTDIIGTYEFTVEYNGKTIATCLTIYNHENVLDEYPSFIKVLNSTGNYAFQPATQVTFDLDEISMYPKCDF